MFACLCVGALGSSRERTTSYRSINTPDLENIQLFVSGNGCLTY